ncbi:MAG: peptidyl-prolyl cis-trans isomerase [Neisseriaceae bacterium]|nr:peptidyl-prolyl cis-trans isomerase [Neisseriaceae bacterium]
MLKKLGLMAFIGLSSTLALAQTQVTLKTSAGDVELVLDEAKAPKTVANFVSYAKSGFYDGTVFHRVIDNFMVQGGGFDQKMTQKPTKAPVANEADNGLKNNVGTIAMARTGDPQSATAQFFINVANNDFLNHKNKTTQGYGYTVFGRVTKGMNVVNSIAKTKTGYQDVPVKAIIINKVIVH